MTPEPPKVAFTLRPMSRLEWAVLLDMLADMGIRPETKH